MAPQYVKPYVKTNKNDLRDAEAIAEAVTRPSRPQRTEDAAGGWKRGWRIPSRRP